MRTDRVEHADGGEGGGRWRALLSGESAENKDVVMAELLNSLIRLSGRQKYEPRPGSSAVLMTVIRTNLNINDSSLSDLIM